MSVPNPGMDFTAFDVLPAAELDKLVENIEAIADGTGLDNNAVGSTKIQDDAVTAAKMQNGVIYRRQGGDTSNWNIPGTTTYDVSATAVKIQCGNITYTGGSDDTITFPVAFTNKPIVIVGTQGDLNISQNGAPGVVSTTNTAFVLRAVNDAAGNLQTSWIAIGV